MKNQSILREYVELVIEKVRSKRVVKTKWGSPTFNMKEFQSLPSSEIMMVYAMNYLEPLGMGSSRSAFVLTPKKVLKIAKNPKGIAQNQAEQQVYTDPATADVAAKMYDADDQGRWIIADLVRPLTNPSEFKQLTGVAWQEFVEDLTMTVSAFARKQGMQLRKSAPDFTKKVFSMAEKGSNKLKLGDLTVLDHWGKTPDGRVVILDYGFTEDVAEKHYSKSQPKPQDDRATRGKPAPDEEKTGR